METCSVAREVGGAVGVGSGGRVEGGGEELGRGEGEIGVVGAIDVVDGVAFRREGGLRRGGLGRLGGLGGLGGLRGLGGLGGGWGRGRVGEVPGKLGVLADVEVGELGKLDLEGEGVPVHREGLRLDHLLDLVGFFGGTELDEGLRTRVVLEKEDF